MTKASEPIWSHCNECGHDTKHAVVSKVGRRRTFVDDPYSVEVGTIWKFLQCLGCEEVALHRLDWCSEDDPQDGPGPGTYFPPRVSRRKPLWIEKLNVPAEYTSLLEEIYIALHADSRRLAMMGVRALIDVVMQRNVGDQGNFGAGLDALVAKQFISERGRQILSAAIDAGHASTHRGHNPSSDSVNVVIDIVENLIHNELLAESAQALKAATPRRSKKKK